jgi:hypothetical protein
MPITGCFLLDAAFDAGLISFADDGAILFSPQFAMEDRDALRIHDHLAFTSEADICRISLGTGRSCSARRLERVFAIHKPTWLDRLN